jgi:hypothetical protein
MEKNSMKTEKGSWQGNDDGIQMLINSTGCFFGIGYMENDCHKKRIMIEG